MRKLPPMTPGAAAILNSRKATSTGSLPPPVPGPPRPVVPGPSNPGSVRRPFPRAKK
jgi:hypothetical protein